MVKPETGQANFSEKRMRSCVSLADLLAEPPSAVSPTGRGLSANSAMARPSGKLETGFETVCKTCGQIRAHHHAVYHYVDIVLVFLVEWRNVGDLIEGAVHLHALEALFLKFERVPSCIRPYARAR